MRNWWAHLSTSVTMFSQMLGQSHTLAESDWFESLTWWFGLTVQWQYKMLSMIDITSLHSDQLVPCSWTADLQLSVFRIWPQWRSRDVNREQPDVLVSAVSDVTLSVGKTPEGCGQSGSHRRRSSRQTASSDTEVVVTAAVSRRIDYDNHASCPPGGATHHRRSSSTRERSNSDATTYFMHHSSSGLSDVIPERRITFRNGSGLVRTGRVGYRRVLFLDAADVGRYRHTDSMDSSSVDSMGVWHCNHEVGAYYRDRDAGGQRDRHADDERGCSNWSSDGDAGESGLNAGSGNWSQQASSDRSGWHTRRWLRNRLMRS